MSGIGEHGPVATARPAQPRPGLRHGADEGAWPFTDTLHLGALPSAVPCARLHAVNVLHEWGLRHLTDDVALIVSELITNAVDASVVMPERPPIALRLFANEWSLVIEVWDHSPLDLEPRQADPGDECGRGLTVVAALTNRWGYQRTNPRHKVVWAELSLPPNPALRASHPTNAARPDDHRPIQQPAG